MRREIILAAASAALAAGCAMNGAGTAQSSGAVEAAAMLRSPAGQQLARATARQESAGVRVRVEATGLPAGTYGAHVHMTGRCDAPDFTSAGGHWNPTGRQHGRENPQGAHKGDLPNLMVGADGRGSLEFVIPDASLSGARLPMLDADGAALVIHERPDDYRTDPTGNSGARIACGAFS